MGTEKKAKSLATTAPSLLCRRPLAPLPLPYLLTPLPPPQWCSGHSRLLAVGSCEQPAVTDERSPAEEVGEVEKAGLPGLRVGAAFLSPDGSGVCPAMPWGEVEAEGSMTGMVGGLGEPGWARRLAGESGSLGGQGQAAWWGSRDRGRAAGPRAGASPARRESRAQTNTSLMTSGCLGLEHAFRLPCAS